MLQSGQWKCSDRRGSELSSSGLGAAPPLGELEVTWKGVTLLASLVLLQEGLGQGTGLPSVGSGSVGPGGAGVRNPLPAGRSSEASRECRAGLRGDLAPELRWGLNPLGPTA